MNRINLKEYMKLPQDKRQIHLDLTDDCLEIGAGSKENRALLAIHLNTTCHYLGKKTGYLCHACHNSKCSNVKHLYWGSAKENAQDKYNDQPDLGVKIKQINIERHGEDHYSRIGALGHLSWKSGKPASTLSQQEVDRRVNLLLESGVNLNQYGWVQKTAQIWEVSHAQVRRFFKSYWSGPTPYQRKKS